MAGAEWLNRYVSLEKETTYGTEPSGSPIYGEVDDESFKATFDLLVRSDMARQVASKAVTNTRYTEGSINFAVQPDNFMGNILASFFTKRVHRQFYDSIAFTNRGFGYHAGTGAIVVSAETIGYWQVRNGSLGGLNGGGGSGTNALNGSAFTTLSVNDSDGNAVHGSGEVVLENGQVTAEGFGTHAGVTVSVDNPGYAIIGKIDGTANNGCYIKYAGINAGAHKLTNVTCYNQDSTFTTPEAGGTAIADNTVVICYENKANGIEPGRVYGYVTVPGSGRGTSATSLTYNNTFFPGLNALLNAGADIGGVAASTITAEVGAEKKHIFEEPTLASESYPSYTVRVGREDKEHTFCGMTATRLSLSANLNEYVMASVDFLGQSEKAPGDIQTSFSYSGNDVDALHFAEAELFVDGSANKSTKIRSISLEININRDLESAYAVGSNTITRMPPSRTREITGTMEFNEILYSDDTTAAGEPSYQDLATATSVHKIHRGQGTPALKLKFTAAGSAATTDFVEIDLYNIRFEAPTASVSGRDPARMSVGFQAFYDSKATGAAKAITVKMAGTNLQSSNY
jgi:hypothetical protein